MAIQRGRSERRGESYSLSYVEPLSDARTKLGDFFSILLGTIVTKRAEGNVTLVHTDRNSECYVRKARRGLTSYRARKVDDLRKTSVLYVSIPAELNVSDVDEGFAFQGHTLLKLECFLVGKEVSCEDNIVEWKPRLPWIVSDVKKRESCDLWMNE